MLFPVLGVTLLLRCSRAENHTELCVSLSTEQVLCCPWRNFRMKPLLREREAFNVLWAVGRRGLGWKKLQGTFWESAARAGKLRSCWGKEGTELAKPWRCSWRKLHKDHNKNKITQFAASHKARAVKTMKQEPILLKSIPKHCSVRASSHRGKAQLSLLCSTYIVERQPVLWMDAYYFCIWLGMKTQFGAEKSLSVKVFFLLKSVIFLKGHVSVEKCLDKLVHLQEKCFRSSHSALLLFHTV